MKEKLFRSTNIPQAFLNRMEGLMGDEYQAFQSSLMQPSLTGLRVNSLKLPAQKFIQISPFNLSPVSWCSSGFIVQSDDEFSGSQSPGRHPYHSAGLYYLQEPSAMAVAEVLAPHPGEAVLDLAAAPGGKATHLAALMQNAGLLVANEIHPRRVWDLAENLERCGVTNAIVTNETPERLAQQFGAYFDRVLLDAPCSGEGMFRKSEIARLEWKPALVQSCANRQYAILDQAARMVKSGGYLAYTTCTFSVEENEAVIAGFLSRHPEFELAPTPPTAGFQPARPEWMGLSSDHYLNQATRIWPHLSQGEGHFIALLRKKGDRKPEPTARAGKYAPKPRGFPSLPLSQSARLILSDFCRANLDLVFDNSRLILDGSYIYLKPPISPILPGLKVIRPGWWLGTVSKRRFTPSHSLALGLKSTQTRLNLPLHIGDSRLSAYLGGESFPSAGEDGWILVTVAGHPLGWGKRVKNVIKNFYPHGLRWIA